MATENQPSSSVPTSRFGAAVGFFWGSGMLGLFALWLHKGHAEVSIAVITLMWILAGCSLLTGIWQSRTAGKAGQVLDSAVEAARRRTLGRLLVLGGGVLAGLAIYLISVLGLEGFGEAVGLGLFALVPLIGGVSMLVSGQTAANFFPGLVEKHVVLQNALLVIGVVCVGMFIWLAFGKKIGTDYFVQLAALLFEGLLAFTCAFWLLSAKQEDRTPFSFRCLLLIFGGVTGLILALLAASLIYVWRQDLVLGGLNGWKGEKGYHIWICAYLGLIGLVLMFGSVLITRMATRTHIVLRQVLYGYNAVVSGLLLLAVLVVLNVLTFAAFPMDIQWNRSGLTTLNQSTKNFLSNMKEPVTIYVLMPNLESFGDVRTLLGNCQAQSEKLTVKYVADTDNETYTDLARRFPDLVGGSLKKNSSIAPCLLLVVGPLGDNLKKPPLHAIIPDRKLFDISYDERTKKETQKFNGEAEIMRQLSFLLQGRNQRKIYFLQGNDELDLGISENPERRLLRAPMLPLGAEKLASRLRKDNYQVEGLSFSGSTREVPQDAWALVVPGPSKPIPKETFEALDRFMARGGRMLVTLDLVLNRTESALEKSGMENYLKKFGVNVGDSFVFRYPKADNDVPRRVLASMAKSENLVAKLFLDDILVLDSVRVVRASTVGKFKGEVLLEVDPVKNAVIWEESSLRALYAPFRYLQDLDENFLYSHLSKEPLPVAVAVSEEPSRPDDSVKPRLVVFGDTEFISNFYLARPNPGELNYAVFTSALEWMSERQDFIGPRPKESQFYMLSPSASDNIERMRFMPTWFMILGIFGLGIGVWLVRRR